MIRINLLPSDITKRTGGGAKRLQLPKGGAWPYVLGLLFGYLVIGYAAYSLYASSEESTRKVKQAEDNKAKKEKQIKQREAEFEAQNAASQEIEQKWQVAQALMNPANRLFWSEKLNMMARARLELAVFITKIALDEQIVEEETEESKLARAAWAASQGKEGAPKTPEPKQIMTPIINQTVRIEAIAYGADTPQRLRQVGAFEASLRNLAWTRQNGTSARFVDALDPTFVFLPQKMDKVGGLEVLRFGLQIKALPQKPKTTIETPGSAPPAPGAPAQPATGGAAQ